MPQDEYETRLWFRLRDKDTFSHDDLGQVEMDVDPSATGPQGAWYDVERTREMGKDVRRGCVRFCFFFLSCSPPVCVCVCVCVCARACKLLLRVDTLRTSRC